MREATTTPVLSFSWSLQIRFNPVGLLPTCSTQIRVGAPPFREVAHPRGSVLPALEGKLKSGNAGLPRDRW